MRYCEILVTVVWSAECGPGGGCGSTTPITSSLLTPSEDMLGMGQRSVLLPPVSLPNNIKFIHLNTICLTVEGQCLNYYTLTARKHIFNKHLWVIHIKRWLNVCLKMRAVSECFHSHCLQEY